MGDNGAEVLTKHCSGESTNSQLLELVDLSENGLTAVGMEHVMNIVRTSELNLNDYSMLVNEHILLVLGCICVWVHVYFYYYNYSVYHIITGSTTLRELILGTNDIGDNGMSVITKELQSNKKLSKLEVKLCGLSVKGTIARCILHVLCD